MVSADQQIYLLSKKKPNKAHANDQNQVLYLMGGWHGGHSSTWISSSYSHYPEGATHWMMLPDSPAPVKTPKELQDEAFHAWLKEKYEDVVVRTAMFSTLKEAFLLGVKHGTID